MTGTKVRSCRLTFEDLAVQAKQSHEESVVSHRRVALEDSYDSAHERDAEQWILPVIHEHETKREIKRQFVSRGGSSSCPELDESLQ